MLRIPYKEGVQLVEVCKCQNLISTMSMAYINFISRHFFARQKQKSKQKTGIQKKTINHEYNETLKVHMVIVIVIIL